MKQILITCRICNKTRMDYLSNLVNGRGKFCSRKCYAKSITGRILSNTTRERISKSNKGLNLGRIVSEETKLNMGKAQKIRLSNPSNHWNYQGGITNYERKLYLNLRRRSNKINNGGYHTQKEWINLKKKFNLLCLSCGKKEPDITLTEDHIVPISMGGTDDITNIQPLCKSCNCKKHTKVINYATI